jgi:hypothetical protein
MKRFFAALAVLALVFSSSAAALAYELTARDQVLIERAHTKIEKLSEKTRAKLLRQIERALPSMKSERNVALFSALLAYYAEAPAASIVAGDAPMAATGSTTTGTAPTSTGVTATGTTATGTVTPSSSGSTSAKTFKDGTYVIGTDLAPGTYRTLSAPSALCYWARTSGFGGSVAEINANEITKASTIVTIGVDDKGFTSTGCGTWTSDLSAVTDGSGSFGNGTFIVGTDVAPGTYRSAESKGCYYARLSGFSGSLDEIIANANTDAAAIVTIAADDKGFKSMGCGTWTKME